MRSPTPELEVKVKATDAQELVMDGMQKMREPHPPWASSLAGLIVGASLLMRVTTSFQLFGYPGLGILCFIAATAGGFLKAGDQYFCPRLQKPEKVHALNRPAG